MQYQEVLRTHSVGQIENWLHGAKILEQIQKKNRKTRLQENCENNTAFDPAHINKTITLEFDPEN